MTPRRLGISFADDDWGFLYKYDKYNLSKIKMSMNRLMTKQLPKGYTI